MDKIDRLLDIIEHPDLYTEQEIETMLADPEVRKVYDLLDKTKATLTPVPTPDVAAEWHAFKSSHTVKNSPAAPRQKSPYRLLKFFPRNIAAAVALGIVSLAAVAAAVGVGVSFMLDKKVSEPVDEEAVAAESSESQDTLIVADETLAPMPETIVFDNETLELIAERIGEYYGFNVEFASEAPKSLRLYFRWNTRERIEDAVESLNNFEQIHLTVEGRTIKID